MEAQAGCSEWGPLSRAGVRPHLGRISESCLDLRSSSLSPTLCPAWFVVPFPLHSARGGGTNTASWGGLLPPQSTPPRVPVWWDSGGKLLSLPLGCLPVILIQQLEYSGSSLPSSGLSLNVKRSKIKPRFSHAVWTERGPSQHQELLPQKGILLFLSKYNFKKHVQWTSWGFKIKAENEQRCRMAVRCAEVWPGVESLAG